MLISVVQTNFVMDCLCFSLYSRAVDREIYQCRIPSVPSSFDCNCCRASLRLQVMIWI